MSISSSPQKSTQSKERETVYWFDELLGWVIEDPSTLTKEQLLQAIERDDRCVVICSDGQYDLINHEGSEYKFK